MKTKILLIPLMVIVLASTVSGRLLADQSEDEAAIRKAAASYVEAFNRQDAKAIAALWAPDAVYINSITGEQVVGRKAIEEQLVAIFKETKDTKIEVNVDSVQFVSPSVAIEKGTVRILRAKAEPDVTAYSSVHIKIGGKWLVDRMSEEAIEVDFSNYEKLKDLEWMIGTWVDQDDEAKLETQCRWTKNQNFMVRSFTVSIEDRIDLSGMQIIGWDPNTRKIRSWVFDSDGGFGHSTWTKKEDSWIIKSAATLSDGRKSSSIRIIKKIDDDTITWQSTGRAIDGEILPNIKPIKIKRNSDSE